MRTSAKALLATMLIVSACSRCFAVEPEDELKSAVVLSFLRYSEWPVRPTEALSIGIVGRPSLVEIFRRTLDGKVAGGHPIRIVDLNAAPAEARCCNVLYVAYSKPDEIKRVLAAPHSPHALTIGESDRFLDCGGAVNLLVVEGRMSFEVSLAAISRGGISISSTLLRFGRIRDAGKGKPPA